MLLCYNFIILVQSSAHTLNPSMRKTEYKIYIYVCQNIYLMNVHSSVANTYTRLNINYVTLPKIYVSQLKRLKRILLIEKIEHKSKKFFTCTKVFKFLISETICYKSPTLRSVCDLCSNLTPNLFCISKDKLFDSSQCSVCT